MIRGARRGMMRAAKRPAGAKKQHRANGSAAAHPNAAKAAEKKQAAKTSTAGGASQGGLGHGGSDQTSEQAAAVQNDRAVERDELRIQRWDKKLDIVG